jgi:hypothetical protein
LRNKYCSAEEVASKDVQTKLPWKKIGAIQSLKVVDEKKNCVFLETGQAAVSYLARPHFRKMRRTLLYKFSHL